MDAKGFEEILKDLKEPERTRKAISLAISKWCKIRDLSEADLGPDNCALCYLYFDDECIGCPVCKKTGQPVCRKTPYKAFARHQSFKHGGRAESRCYCFDCKEIADDMVRFLHNLYIEYIAENPSYWIKGDYDFGKSTGSLDYSFPEFKVIVDYGVKGDVPYAKIISFTTLKGFPEEEVIKNPTDNALLDLSRKITGADSDLNLHNNRGIFTLHPHLEGLSVLFWVSERPPFRIPKNFTIPSYRDSEYPAKLRKVVKEIRQWVEEMKNRMVGEKRHEVLLP